MSMHGSKGEEAIIYRQENTKLPQDKELTLISWNLGYAGLGYDSDFVVDGGSRFLPPSQASVEKNAQGIISFIESNRVDVFLLQEIADYSLFIRSTNLIGMVQDHLKNYDLAFVENINLPLIFIRLRVGNATFSRYQLDTVRRVELPREKKKYYGIRQKYPVLIYYLPIKDSDQEWVIMNVHLAAFDKDAETRELQLDLLRSLMLEEYEKGNPVIIGGDWNMRLASTEFPYTTEEKYLFWIHDLAEDFTTLGWKWGIDPSAPTVRTLERAYKKGENYTCIIDGFLVSPNINILLVKTTNLEFRNTDHNPVYIKVSFSPKAP